MNAQEVDHLNRDELPSSVLAYLDNKSPSAAAAAFSPDATVRDDGATHASRQEILEWLQQTSTEFTYTTTFQRAIRLSEDGYVVWNRLEGNFPGGLVDLRYTFALQAGLISRLEISA